MSEKIYTLSICLLMVTISFSVLIGLTLVFSVSVNVYVALILLLFTLIAPLLAYIHHSKTYFVVLPASYLGSWFISMMFFTSLSIPFMISIYLISAVPATIVTVMHIFSRERNMLLGRVPLSSLAKTGFAEASLIFLVIGLSMLGLGTVKLDPFNKVAFYSLLLVMYCSSSLMYVNSAYRYRLICKMSSTSKIEEKINAIWEKLMRKFSYKKESVELLRYYFSEAIRLFEGGSYEMSFLSAYKIIREPTVVDPREYISDKREGKPSSFSEIRTVLVHSRRRDIQINPKRIRETKTKLPQYALEIIERAIKFLEKLTLDENMTHINEVS